MSPDLLIKTNDVLMTSIDEFYTMADNIKWYLLTTQDMPNTVNEKIDKMIISLDKSYGKLKHHINNALKEESLQDYSQNDEQ